MKNSLLFIALTLPMLCAFAGQQPLSTISDPPGDDNGAGTLIYPQRADFQAGDLDLLQMKISRDEEGFWFEATFRNPIRAPDSVPGSAGSESLASFARKGFYQFNIDVYVDTDRIKDSGYIFTLPGRQVRIDPSYAWEKAVILTPRPELMRHQLLGALAEQFPDWTNVEAEASVDQSIFFPTRVRVRGKSITYFVPASFFSGSDGTNWAVTGLVTGAMTNIPADLTLLPSTIKPLNRLQLGVMQPLAGHPKDTFGYSGSVPSPVVDMLCSSAELQAQMLKAKVGLTGISWGAHTVSSALTSGVASGTPAADRKPDGSNIASPAVPIGNLFQPENSTASPFSATVPAEPMPQANSAIIKRLQALQQMFEQKLIDEAEYKQQKQNILKDL